MSMSMTYIQLIQHVHKQSGVAELLLTFTQAETDMCSSGT